MTSFLSMPIRGCAMPLGTLSDSIPHGAQQRVRVSAIEARMRVFEASTAQIPVTLSDCMSKHAPRVVGVTQTLTIGGNELLFYADLWTGLLPADFDPEKMGVSPEFEDVVRIHKGWMTGFRFNALALVLREHAAFRSTWIKEVQ